MEKHLSKCQSSNVVINLKFSIDNLLKKDEMFKFYNTLKALVGITLSGAISFVSALFGGILQKEWDGYDMVMADRGFDVQELFIDLGAVVNIPPFLNGKS